MLSVSTQSLRLTSVSATGHHEPLSRREVRAVFPWVFSGIKLSNDVYYLKLKYRIILYITSSHSEPTLMAGANQITALVYK